MALQVYGDIGTSPLYAIAAIFTEPPSSEDVLGIISLIIWLSGAILVVEYATIVLRADDHGEGI